MEERFTLAALRVRAGYTQKEAAEKLGITRRTLQKWEKDSGNISVTRCDEFEKLYMFPSDLTYYGKASDISDAIRGAYDHTA